MSKRNIISKGISRDQRRSIKNQLIRFGKDVTNRFIGIQNNDNRISRSDFLNINNSFNNIPGNAINLKHTSNIEILGIENNKENDFDNTNNIDVFDSKNRENFIENNEDIIEDCEDNYFDNEDSIPDHIRQLYYDNYENAHNNGKPLFKGTNKTTAQFLARFLSLKLKSQVSDNTAEKFSKLFCDFLPENHTCPRTLKGIRNELAFSVPDVSNIFENTNEHVYDNGRLLKFPFMDLIKLIITCNLKYFLRNYNGETKTLNLLLHTDGAPLSKSSKVQMWPMSGIFLDLPPKVRIAFHNIVIFSIWLTNQSENFNIICNELRSELKNKVYAVKGSNQNKDINFYYRINIESITRDIPALRKANNLTGCNGSYGCTYCFHKGAYAKTGSGAGNGKMVFNNAKDMSLRTSSEYERYAKMLDNNPSQVMFGMNGRSHLEGIVNVPEGIVIDYMHTVLLGPIKEDMTTIRDGDKKIFANNYKIPKLKESTIMFFDNSLETFILPREYKRTIKPLKEFTNYKALEWKLFMFYGFPTIFLESLKDEVSDFVILQLAIISKVGMLMMDNISEDQISLSSNLLSLWFDERVKLLGFNGIKLKSHIITHLPVIAKKFGNITKYSCFAGEGLIQTLGRMISQRTENNSLNQIKKRFKDLHMACYVIRKEEEIFENVFMNISNVFRDIFKAKIPLLHQYKFIDKIDFKGFSIRASMNGFIDRDNFLITQEEKDGEIFYKPGILLAVAINEKKEMLYFVKELVVIKKMLFNERFNKITLTTGLKNLINVVDDSNFFKKYFIIDNCYKNLSWVTNDSNITVIKNINRIYSKALIIESISQTIYVCPMLHSFEHN